MKVCELLENHDWDEAPISLKYLFKQQQSAVHQLELELRKTATHIAKDSQWYSECSLLLKSSFFKLMKVETTTASSFSFEWSSAVPAAWLSILDKFPSVQREFTKMIKAKRTFEKAGGKYPEGKYTNDLQESDDWSNGEITVSQLYRNQMARTYEYLMFIKILIKKYKSKLVGLNSVAAESFSKGAGSRWSCKTTTSSMKSWPKFNRWLEYILYEATPKETLKNQILFNAMIDAKTKFEGTGGDYDRYA